MTSVQSKLTKGRIVVLSCPRGGPFPFGIWISIKCMVPWTNMGQPRKWTHDRFSRSCTAHRVPNAHRQTDHATCDSCSNRPHLCTACMRCSLIIIIIMKQGVALKGRNRTGPPYSIRHPNAHAPDHPRTRRQRYRRQTTTTTTDTTDRY